MAKQNPDNLNNLSESCLVCKELQGCSMNKQIPETTYSQANNKDRAADWPPRPESFGELLTPVEAAQYLRLDETDSHTPKSAIRTLNYWRDKGQLKATKFARRVWYRRAELDRFLEIKTQG